MHSNKLITVEEFKSLIHNGNGYYRGIPRVIKENVCLDFARIALGHLSLKGIWFEGLLMIRNLQGNGHIYIDDSRSRQIHIENCAATALSITNVRTEKVIVSGGCCFDYAEFANLKIEQSFEIFGLKLKSHLKIVNIRFENSDHIRLHHEESGSVIETPRLFTDNLLAAAQFNLARIPVFMDSERVEEYLKYTKPEEEFAD